MLFLSKKCLQLGAGLAALAMCASADSFSPVYYSLGPVPSLSSSYAAYTANAQAGVLSGSAVGCTGTYTNGACIPGSPTTFLPIYTVANDQIILTSEFHNWQGSANPTGAFANEYGTVLFFSTVLTGTGNDLRLSDITYSQNDTDQAYPDYFQYDGSFAGQTYSNDVVGYLADGTEVPAGTDGSTPVNKIVITSTSVGYDVTGQYDGYSPALQMFFADNDVNFLGNFTLNTCFADNAVGAFTCNSVNVTNPEPAAIGLFGLGFAGIGLIAARRKK
jgi:hypothetical protein